MAEEWRGLWPENCERKPQKVVLAERFVGEDGRALAWQVEPLAAADLLAVYREGAGRNVGVRLLAAAVSVPDLTSAALQDKYGVMGAEQLLLAMLSPGEFERLEQVFREVNL